INAFPAGTSVKLKLLRQGQILERTIELAKRKLTEPIIATNRPAPWRGLRVDYASTLPRAVHPQGILDAMSRGGVVVADVLPGSPADRAGLKDGLMITHVEGQPIRNPREFAKAVAGREGPVGLATDQGRITVK